MFDRFASLSLAVALLLAWTVICPAQDTGTDPPAEKKTDADQAQPKADAPDEPNADAGDEAKENDATDTPKPPVKQGPAAKAWDEQFTAWKDLLKGLHDLREEYQTAKDDELEGIRKKYDDLLAKGRTMIPVVRKSAVDAFVETPNDDRQLGRFLAKLVADDIKADRYEQANELVTMLVEKECEAKGLHNMAGITAFALNDFDAAQKLFNEAAADGTLTKESRVMQDQVEEYKKLWKEEQALRIKEAEDDDLPRVKITTSKGDIVLELFENEAPQTVANFINLVENQFYDGLTFHRVLQAFMAQGGCPKGDGTGGPGYKIYCECYEDNHRKHFRGSVSMAHAGRDSGGSQFFMMFLPNSSLDGKHTVFGRVIEGMDVLAEIQRRDPKARPPLPEPDKIIKAEVLRKRDHKYVPTKVE